MNEVNFFRQKDDVKRNLKMKNSQRFSSEPWNTKFRNMTTTKVN